MIRSFVAYIFLYAPRHVCLTGTNTGPHVLVSFGGSALGRKVLVKRVSHPKDCILSRTITENEQSQNILAEEGLEPKHPAGNTSRRHTEQAYLIEAKATKVDPKKKSKEAALGAVVSRTTVENEQGQEMAAEAGLETEHPAESTSRRRTSRLNEQEYLIEAKATEVDPKKKSQAGIFGAVVISALPYLDVCLVLHMVGWLAAKRVGWPFSATKESALSFGHFVCCLIASLVLTSLGSYGWFFECARPGFDRLGGYAWSSEVLMLFMIGFQMYLLVWAYLAPTLVEKSHGQVIHQIIVFTCVSICCANQYLHYYACFFFGVIELSSVPFTLMDFFKAFPHMAERYPLLKAFTRIMFAVIFLLLRVICWTFVAARALGDSIDELQNGRLGKPKYVVLTACVGYASIMLMNNFWAGLILAEVAKWITGDDKYSRASARIAKALSCRPYRKRMSFSQ